VHEHSKGGEGGGRKKGPETGARAEELSASSVTEPPFNPEGKGKKKGKPATIGARTALCLHPASLEKLLSRIRDPTFGGKEKGKKKEEKILVRPRLKNVLGRWETIEYRHFG